MDHFRATAISAAGMQAQKARVEAAALNLANMNTTQAPGEPGYRPLTAVVRAQPGAFAQVLEGGVTPYVLAQAQLVPAAAQPPRRAYEPGHPHADAQGMVSYPAIDHAREMLTVTAALRSYEANLAVLQVTKSMAAKALEIGGQ